MTMTSNFWIFPLQLLLMELQAITFIQHLQGSATSFKYSHWIPLISLSSPLVCPLSPFESSLTFWLDLPSLAPVWLPVAPNIHSLIPGNLYSNLSYQGSIVVSLLSSQGLFSLFLFGLFSFRSLFSRGFSSDDPALFALADASLFS